MSVKKIVGATEVRNHFGRFLKQVYRGDEHLIVEKSGIPVAALIGMKEYEVFRRWLAMHVHDNLGAKLGAELDRQGISEEDLVELMEAERNANKQQPGTELS